MRQSNAAVHALPGCTDTVLAFLRRLFKWSAVLTNLFTVHNVQELELQSLRDLIGSLRQELDTLKRTNPPVQPTSYAAVTYFQEG